MDQEQHDDKQHPQLYLQCEHCGEFFEHNGHKRRRWCTDRCKVAAWRQKTEKSLKKD